MGKKHEKSPTSQEKAITRSETLTRNLQYAVVLQLPPTTPDFRT